MTKYLIIGKDGTLGSEFQRMLGNQAVYLGIEDLDITNESKVLEKISEIKPETIINCAAYNAVDKAEDEPEVANLINGTAVGYLAKAAEVVGAKFVHYSTNYVFSGDDPNGYKETDQPNPQSNYGRSKLLGEVEAQKHCSKTFIARTTWLYGKQGQSKSSKKNFVDIMLELAEQKSEIECVSDQYGQPTWTFDLANHTLQLVSSQNPYGIYHFVNDGQTSWYGWAEEIFKIKNINIALKANSFKDWVRPADRPQYGILMNTKLPKLRPWQEALREYLNESI